VALVGGLGSFLIASFRQSRATRRDKRERADRLTIMEILERDLIGGLTEQQIKETFRSPSTTQFRKRLGASKPGKLDDHDFAIYLRDLQWHHMIDQIGDDRYRLRSAALSYEQRELRREQATAALSAIVPLDRVLAVFQKHGRTLSGYRQADVVRGLLSLNRTEDVGRLAQDLESADPETALSAAEAFLNVYQRD
jgi:hypothetical protein